MPPKFPWIKSIKGSRREHPTADPPETPTQPPAPFPSPSSLQSQKGAPTTFTDLTDIAKVLNDPHNEPSSSESEEEDESDAEEEVPSEPEEEPEPPVEEPVPPPAREPAVPSAPIMSGPASPKRPDKGKSPAPSSPVPPRDPDTALSAEHTLLLEKLQEINGQDAYSVAATALGRLNRANWLAIPRDVALKVCRPEEVGTVAAATLHGYRDLAAIYVVNKDAAIAPATAIVKAFLQMEAIKAGWYRGAEGGQHEVNIVPEVDKDDALATLCADFATVQLQAATMKSAAYVVPLVAEHVFRTMGHHYLTSDSATYLQRYAATLRSCLLPEVATVATPEVLYHEAFHWVTPKVAREILMAQLDGDVLPEALKIRANAAPAGTALVTTSAAVIETMRAQKLDEKLAELGGFNLEAITNATAVVKRDPCKYHKAHFAYGREKPNAAEAAVLAEAVTAAASFAPVSQAFVTVYLRDAALSRAKALTKHSQNNPVLTRRCERYFRSLARREITDIKSLFSDVETDASAD